MPTWSSRVRYAEVDQQGVVFNAHYLLYCDEALGAFCRQRELREFADQVRVVTSTLTWAAPARWGEIVEVQVRCIRVGRTSTALGFTLTCDGRPCCLVETTYVYTDVAGSPQPISDEVRAALTR